MVTTDEIDSGDESESALIGRILLVDDDETLLELLKLILTSRGHEVTTAVDGQEAIELLQTERFDLIITDIVMPRMGGSQLNERLTADRGEIPVLFMSGYATNDPKAAFSIDRNKAILSKPFLPGALVARVVELVDEDRSRPMSS